MVLSVNSIFLPMAAIPGLSQPLSTNLSGTDALVSQAQIAVEKLAALEEGRSSHGLRVNRYLLREFRTAGWKPLCVNPAIERLYFMQIIAPILSRILTSDYNFINVDENRVQQVFNLFGLDYETQRWSLAQTDWRLGLTDDERATIKVDDWRYNVIGAVRLYLEGIPDSRPTYSKPLGNPEQILFGLLEKFTTGSESASLKASLELVRDQYDREAAARVEAARTIFERYERGVEFLKAAYPDWFAEFDKTPFRKRAEVFSGLLDFSCHVQHVPHKFPSVRRFLQWMNGGMSSRDFFALTPNRDDPELDSLIESGFALLAEEHYAGAGSKFEDVAIAYLNRGKLDEMMTAAHQADKCREDEALQDQGMRESCISSEKIAPLVLSKARCHERKKELLLAAEHYRFHARMLFLNDENAARSRKKAAVLLERAGDLTGAIWAYQACAHDLIGGKKNDAASAVYRRIARLSRNLGNKAEEAGATEQIATTLYGLIKDQPFKAPYQIDRRKWKRVARLHGTCAALWKEAGDFRKFLENILNQAEVLRQMGELSCSLAVFRQAFNSSQSAGDKSGIANALYYMAMVKNEMKQFEASAADYLSARDLFAELGMEGGELKSIEGASHAFKNLGRLGDAISLYEDAIAKWSEPEKTELLASCLRWIIGLLFKAGRYEEAISAAHRATELDERMMGRQNDPYSTKFPHYRFLADSFAHEEKWELAADFYERAGCARLRDEARQKVVEAVG